MKILTGMLCLLCLTDFVFGQNTSARKIDSTKQNQSLMIRDRATITSDDPFIIIDDKQIDKSLSKHVLEELNPIDILEIKVLKDSALDRTSSAGFHRQTILITTKQYATLQYQTKFGAFSKKYKDYLDSFKSDDQQITYVINGELVAGKDRNDEISQLYKIPKEKIKGIGFLENLWYNGSPSKKYLLTITTKQ